LLAAAIQSVVGIESRVVVPFARLARIWSACNRTDSSLVKGLDADTRPRLLSLPFVLGEDLLDSKILTTGSIIPFSTHFSFF
jgi:hypothetical protein